MLDCVAAAVCVVPVTLMVPVSKPIRSLNVWLPGSTKFSVSVPLAGSASEYVYGPLVAWIRSADPVAFVHVTLVRP